MVRALECYSYPGRVDSLLQAYVCVSPVALQDIRPSHCVSGGAGEGLAGGVESGSTNLIASQDGSILERDRTTSVCEVVDSRDAVQQLRSQCDELGRGSKIAYLTYGSRSERFGRVLHHLDQFVCT